MRTSRLKIDELHSFKAEIKPTMVHFLWAGLPGLFIILALFGISLFVAPPVHWVCLFLTVPICILGWGEFNFYLDGGEVLRIEEGRLAFERTLPSGSPFKVWRPLVRDAESFDVASIVGLEFGTSKRKEPRCLFARLEDGSRVKLSRLTRYLSSDDREKLAKALTKSLSSTKKKAP